MLKIIGMVIVATLTFLSACENGERPGPREAGPATNEMEVMVLFSGLMVFNKNPHTDAYEVGIPNQEISEGHEFCVQRLGAPRMCRDLDKSKHNVSKPPDDPPFLPNGVKWTLSVTRPPNEGPHGAMQKDRRRPDVEGGQHDFGWIIDLDGEKFHNTRLELNGGQLQPIIQLPKVKLLTKYKSPDFFRQKGNEEKELFGFVAETIGFRVQLKKDEELVLIEERPDPQEDEVITRVPYVAPSDVGGNYEVVIISNARYPPHRTSDFKVYYKLFKGVDALPKYDFEENETEPCNEGNPKPCVALNPVPKYKTPPRTCCGLICTQILLTKWGEPLK